MRDADELLEEAETPIVPLQLKDVVGKPAPPEDHRLGPCDWGDSRQPDGLCKDISAGWALELESGMWLPCCARHLISAIAEGCITKLPLWGEFCKWCGWCNNEEKCVWSVECPKCGVDPKVQCREPGSGRLTGLHHDRWVAVGRPDYR